MTSELPRASLLENVRFTITYQLPSLLRGLADPAAVLGGGGDPV